MDTLLLWSLCLYKVDSLLLSACYPQVELLRVTPETCKGVNVAIFLLFLALDSIKISIAGIIGLLGCLKEDLYAITIEYLDVSLAEQQ